MRTFLGFDFYGSGNVGDDLMLAGFLAAATGKFSCVSKQDVESQRHRFPQVDWVDPEPQYDRWLGVGDTPFQVTSGPWFLDHLAKAARGCVAADIPMAMVGVGVEAEAMREVEKVRPIVAALQKISTRDEFSANLLVDALPEQASKVFVGADLAHIALSELTFPRAVQHELAINYFAEHATSAEKAVVRQFILKQRDAIYIANETRRGIGAEFDIYRSMFFGLRNAFAKAPPFYSPTYQGTSLWEMVSHFSQYETVISSRYHALVTAAWAGCKVAAMGRGSKVVALADQLGIHVVKGALTVHKLDEACEAARLVDRGLLARLATAAAMAVTG